MRARGAPLPSPRSAGTASTSTTTIVAVVAACVALVSVAGAIGLVLLWGSGGEEGEGMLLHVQRLGGWGGDDHGHDHDRDHDRLPNASGTQSGVFKSWTCPPNTTSVRFLLPHVNKAGGRTLQQTFGSFRNSFVTSAARSDKYAFEIIGRHRAFAKVAAENRARLPGPEERQCARWIFFMRRPEERLLSAFYTSTGRSDFFHFPCEDERIKVLMSNNAFTFEDFAQLPREWRATCFMAENLFVRYLVDDNGQARQLTDADLAQAKAKLVGNMSFVGFVEDFATSMELLNWSLDLGLKFYTPIYNWNPHSRTPNVSENARQVLREMSSWDLELYRFALDELFAPRIRAMRADRKQAPTYRTHAECSEVLCWIGEKSWAYSDKPPAQLVQAGMSLGEIKRKMLCAPKNGCVWKGGT